MAIYILFNEKNEEKKQASIFYNFGRPLTECNFWLSCTSLSKNKSQQRGFVSLL